MKWSEVAQSCLTLCDPIDCSVPGSSLHGIFQAIVLEWIVISFSRGSSQPRAQSRVSRIVGRRFTIWATREVLRYWCNPQQRWLAFRKKYSSLYASHSTLKMKSFFFTAIYLYSSHPEHTPSLEKIDHPEETRLTVAPHLKWLLWKYIFDYGHDKSGRLDLPGIGVEGTVIKYLHSTDTQ